MHLQVQTGFPLRMQVFVNGHDWLALSRRSRRSDRRKRVGVEPTKDWLTAPSGFEVRTFHRERFSSSARAGFCTGGFRRQQVKAARMDLPQVATPQRDTAAIEVLENLDGHLPAVVEPVA